ncbi:acyl-CoA synthetase [Rhodovulum sp. DZ06]|uniref:acyl-CoA synthetase n=1 Tax=Rhodovulum sp. DZ06 TaxID=3425126 RepID=UPI003D34FB31
MLHPSHHAAVTPDKPAYIMAGSGETITYAELDRISMKGAQALRRLGVGPGDNIALMMENRREFMEIVWAAHRAGVIYTAISRYLGPAEAGYILRDCGAKAFIVSAADADKAAAIRAEAPDAACLTVGGAVEGFRRWEDAVAEAPATPPADECAGEDMLYSSGTTGRPKGILRGWEKRPVDWAMPVVPVLVDGLFGLSQDSTYLCPAPLYHAAPLRFTLRAASLGATCVIMEKFDPEGALRAIETHRVTHAQFVPTHFVRMLKLPEAARAGVDLSSLQKALHAAAPCPAEVKEAMIDWWGPILEEYYAGTEANGITYATAAEWLAHRGTVGRSLLGEIRILGPDGSELPRGETGGVYFDSGIDFEYRGDPDKTAEAFARPGCSTLGDIGYLDEDGFVHLTDRAAFTIISGGVNVYPQETEDLLIAHPEVMDAAVFGIPDEDLGEAVHAVVQPKGVPRDGLAEELRDWLRARLSHVKVPKAIELRAELPRTETGKLMKKLLKAEYAAAPKARSPEPAG